MRSGYDPIDLFLEVELLELETLDLEIVGPGALLLLPDQAIKGRMLFPKRCKVSFDGHRILHGFTAEPQPATRPHAREYPERVFDWQ